VLEAFFETLVVRPVGAEGVVVAGAVVGATLAPEGLARGAVV